MNFCKNLTMAGGFLWLAKADPGPARVDALSAAAARGRSTMRTMKAAVIYEAGGPEVLKIESRPIPKPQAGGVLIRVEGAYKWAGHSHV